jgi:PTS system nitrogen regulatory IIA component
MLSELLDLERIRIPLASETKPDVLRELVSLIPGRDDADVQEELLQAVLDRESRLSTGIGQGVAIPHGKSELVDSMEVTLGISAKPIEYDALDGEPVEIFFLLLSPPDLSGPHIKALAQISRLLSSHDIRDRLAEAESADQALDLIREGEALLGE